MAVDSELTCAHWRGAGPGKSTRCTRRIRSVWQKSWYQIPGSGCQKIRKAALFSDKTTSPIFLAPGTWYLVP